MYTYTWYIDTYIEIDTAWRFQRRVNKKKVVFIEYGDCVIIAGRLRSMTNRLVREIPAIQSRMSPALMVYVGHFLIWSDRPILCPESVVASRDIRLGFRRFEHRRNSKERHLSRARDHYYRHPDERDRPMRCPAASEFPSCLPRKPCTGCSDQVHRLENVRA